MLKLLKVQLNIEVKADPSDKEDLNDRVAEALEVLIENDELEFEVLEEDDAEDGYSEE